MWLYLWAKLTWWMTVEQVQPVSWHVTDVTWHWLSNSIPSQQFYTKRKKLQWSSQLFLLLLERGFGNINPTLYDNVFGLYVQRLFHFRQAFIVFPGSLLAVIWKYLGIFESKWNKYSYNIVIGLWNIVCSVQQISIGTTIVFIAYSN